MVFAFPLVLVAFSGIDASSGLAGQVAIGRAGLRRLIGVRLVAAMVPVPRASRWSPAPCCRRPAAGGSRRRCWASPTRSSRPGCASPRSTSWRSRRVVILVSAAQAAMLGLSRLGYALAVNRQIPSRIGSLQPHAGDAGRDHRLRRGDGDLPADPGRPRVPGRDLRVRGDDRVHDRGRLGRPAALQGARPRPAVPDAAQRPVPRRLAADPGRAVRRDVGDRVPRAAGRARQRALGRRGLDGRRRLALRRLPDLAGQAGAQARDRAGGRARRGAPPRPSSARCWSRSWARRWTTTSCRPPGGSPPRRTRTTARAAR